ncbi:MAG: hypothetical protein ACLVHD_00940 [Clostridium sp.]
MTTEKVNDLELVKLSDYFTPGKFRTIPGTAMTDRGGITEMQAVFNINTDFAKRLTFQFSTMLVIYGFGILNDKLIEINKSKYVGYKEENVLKRITFNDCGEWFVMVLELSDAPDKLLAVTADDVEYLLNNCLHPAT